MDIVTYVILAEIITHKKTGGIGSYWHIFILLLEKIQVW